MRKKLGQHFLRSSRFTEIIANTLSVPAHHIIVEIGPGTGVLTEYLLQKSDSVVAVEKDAALLSVLEERFSDAITEKKLRLVHSDVRDERWLDYVSTKSYTVIANIPYYITGLLIRSLLTCAHPPASMALVVQKEVAERITKRITPKESILSLSVQLFGAPAYVVTIPRSAFTPAPAVDSALITITDICPPSQKVQDAFFATIHTAFHGKRKVVLKKFSDTPLLHSVLSENGVTDTMRAEDVPFAVWLKVAESLG